MTTQSFISPVDCDTDAHFRAWGSQINAALLAVGITQTADAGQINWATVSIAGYPGFVGYEIYSFNDAAQAAAPIFFRIDWGAVNATLIEYKIQIGSGSDGAGAITGALKSIPLVGSFNTTLGNAYPSYICYRPTDGFLGVALKIGMGGAPYGGMGFVISRTNDTAGAVTDTGINLYMGVGTGSQVRCFTMCPAANQRFPASGNISTSYLASWPFGLSSSFAGGNVQAVPIMALAPEIQVNAKLCGVLGTEIPAGNQFSLNIVGVTPRNYISVGAAFGPMVNATDIQYFTAMLWE